MSSNSNKSLPIGGFIKQSLIDYPGNISSIIFTQACNFRCIYCHNPDLVWPERIKKSEKLDSDSIIDWIMLNKQLLDAVVISGGEPTMHSSLEYYVVRIKELGLKVKLDTNGTNPLVLERLINKKLLDYIAMDVKAPLNLEEYKIIAGEVFNQEQLNNIKSSIELIKNSKVEFEFRTTVLDKFHTVETIETIAAYLESNLYLQNYRAFQDEEKKHLKPLNNLQKVVNNSEYKTYLKIRE